MFRKFAMFAALIAAVAFSTQADAKHRHRKVSPAVPVTAVAVGAASTATYFSLGGWTWNDWSNANGFTRLGAWGATTLGCAALSPIVATAIKQRPLSYREAHILVGSCVVPIIGGYLVNAAYDNGLLWAPDEKPAGHKHRHRHKRMAKN